MLLDLIAHRYPGTKPSDLYGLKSPDNPNGLDEYQAFQLDAGLAFRYSNLERQDQARYVHELRESIKLTGRFHGAKGIKYRKFKGNLGDTHDEDFDSKDDDEGVYSPGSRGTAIE